MPSLGAILSLRPLVLPTDGDQVLSIRNGTTPEPELVELDRLLTIPEEIMQPIKTWS